MVFCLFFGLGVSLGGGVWVLVVFVLGLFICLGCGVWVELVLVGGFEILVVFEIWFWLWVMQSAVLCSSEQFRQHGGALHRPAV